MKQIKLTENELRAKIAECVTSALQGFNEEIDGAADIAGMKNDDEEEGFNPEWAIEDVCEDFGQGPVKIEGVLGRWDGRHAISPISMPDIKSAIYSCIEKSGGEIMDEDDILYYPEKELVVLNVHHHDGTNVFQITPSNGEEELYEAKQVIKKLVKEALFIADNGITVDSNDGSVSNEWDQESLSEDAKEMLEMSDGMCDYNEWEDAFPDMGTDIKIDAWNQACQELGYDDLMVNYQMQEMRKTVEKLVRESFDSFNMSGMMPQQYDYNQQEVNRSNKTKEHIADNEKRSGKSTKGKRALVLNWLKDPSVNCAEIMRKLWNPSSEEEDAARSYFYKCRDGKLNDSGVPYKFSDSDINSLYKIKSEKSA